MHARLRVHFGPAETTELRVVGVGYHHPNSQPAANLPNSYIQRASLELADGRMAAFTFGGAVDGVVAPGELEAVSDALTPAALGLSVFPANAAAWLRYEVEVAEGAVMPTGAAGSAASPAIAGEGCVEGPVGAPSKMLTPGALTTGGGWTNQAAIRVFPAAIIGRTATPQVSVAVIGDSIARGANDGAGDGHNGSGGFLLRGVAGVAARVPTVNLAHYGGTLLRAVAGKERALLKYATHVICNYGTNDLAPGGGRSAAQAYADLKALVAYAKAAGVRVWDQVPVIPRVGSTNAYVDDAGQMPVAGFAAGGGQRDAFNALLAAGAGADFDALIPSHLAVQSQAASDRFVSDGTANRATADGVHPSAWGHGQMAAAVTQRVAGYTAPAGG